MLKSETREIGGKRYAVTQFGTQEGLQIFFWLGKLAGPSIAALVKQWQVKSISQSTVGAALVELANGLQWADFNKLVQACAKCTKQVLVNADGETLNVPLSNTIDTVAFAGDYLSLVQWLGFCLEVNFASFFVGLGLTKLPSSAAQE